MLLIELFPTEVKRGTRSSSDFPAKPKTKRLGGGMEAEVFDHPTRPGSVIKIIKSDKPIPGVPIRPNAQMETIELFMQHQKNPFIPRIYQAKHVSVKGGGEWMYVEMEKLYPFTKKNIRHMIPSTLKQIGVDQQNIDGLIKLGVNKEETPEMPGEWSIKAWSKDHEIWAIIIDAFQEIFNDPMKLVQLSNNAKNKQFKDAVQILLNLIHKYNLDLHPGNLMYRLTSIGPQLVLLDPFYGQVHGHENVVM